MAIRIFIIVVLPLLLGACSEKVSRGTAAKSSGNPIFPGWYADPEGIVFGDTYWVFPTYSDDFDKQLHLDAFSSKDLVTWTKHPSVLDTSIVPWVKQAMWAPSVLEHRGKYYLFFAGNDIQNPARPGYNASYDKYKEGGIGVAVADAPGGPYRDHLGKPLLSEFYNMAQPIDQFVYRDTDGTVYFFYGGWGRCNLGRLNNDFTGFIPWEDGQLFHEVTQEGYVEGPFMFKRKGIYYFMWSEGGWTNGSYKVAYATAPAVTGPYTRQGTILESQEGVATGAGHHSVIQIPGKDEWIIVYHRRPIPNEDRDHRVTCMDKLAFNDDGTIKPVVMTFTGVPAVR
ncbi:glycoside hydrolase family 43 protein [Neolewinella lacunae]|uniref:Family 43 glycosylhydrolase n=1 Tax=Neolewinella lacunae TaxID=1517758 RepID=A0A923PJA0_9BACT|nr:glycoside hydrolase family 43 protein [Neolewinella lacunae]MBC6995115.1 family 43 glycosylhydrolase [Neolewinella lacunae]MDN3634065.1 glycoside hydrolase family 43 protein [Neolewinella lacunae]